MEMYKSAYGTLGAVGKCGLSPERARENAGKITLKRDCVKVHRSSESLNSRFSQHTSGSTLN